MMLRLVLVGIVAGLGVTIPSPPVGLGWLGSAERWANSVLADWDSWRPSDSDGEREHLVVSIHDCEQCRLARAAAASCELQDPAVASSPTTKWAPVNPVADGNKPGELSVAAPVSNQGTAVVSVFDTMEFGDDFYTGIDFKLNSEADGGKLARPVASPVAIATDTPPLAVSQDFEMGLPEVLCGTTDEEVADLVFITEAATARPTNPTSSSDRLVSTDTPSEPDFGELDAVENAETVPLPVVEVSAIAPAGSDPSERPEVVAGDEHFASGEDAAALRDGRDLTVYAPGGTPPVVSEAPALPALSTPSMQLPAAPLPQSSSRAIARSDKPAQSKNPAELPWPAFAPEEELIAKSPAHVVQETTVPWPVFAPVESPISREVTTAIEHPSAVNVAISHANASSGIMPGSTSVITPASPTEPRLDKAVNLTRQAMSAWLSVLVPSETVEVTAR
jgi:hypothetical protein